MLLAGDVTGDQRFIEYASKRLKMISDLSLYFIENKKLDTDSQITVYSVIHPKALDDSGSLCAAMIKAQQAGLNIGFIF